MPPLARLTTRFGRAGALGKRLTLCFDTNAMTQGGMYQCLTHGQLWDPPMVNVLTGFLELGDTFLDIGCHIGYYAVLALQQVGRHGRVFAFEANPVTAGVLLANAAVNRAGNFFPFNCAVGERSGLATLGLSPGDEGMTSLVVPFDETVSVHMTTLDTLQEQLDLRQVRTVKIDVEGYEQQVLAGGKAFFRDVLPENVVFETNRSIAPGQDAGIRASFEARGYACYLVRPWYGAIEAPRFPGHGDLMRLDPGQALAVDYGNILASRRRIDAPPFSLAAIQPVEHPPTR